MGPVPKPRPASWLVLEGAVTPTPRFAGTIALGLLAAWLLGSPACASAPTRRDTQDGMATHYAARFAGRKTASGDIYRPGALTAAHRTLPFGTVVRVTRLGPDGKPGRAVVVRINDRGPFGNRRRIIDLSAAAAKKLGIFGGVGRVRLEILRHPRR